MSSQQSDQRQPQPHSTVHDLMRMLSGAPRSSGASSGGGPPPVPPKPRTQVPHRPPMEHTLYHQSHHEEWFVGASSGGGARQQAPTATFSTHFAPAATMSNLSTAAGAYQSELLQHPTQIAAPALVPNTAEAHHNKPLTITLLQHTAGDELAGSHAIKQPLVTESSEEPNNNHNHHLLHHHHHHHKMSGGDAAPTKWRPTNTSTVEILEVADYQADRSAPGGPPARPGATPAAAAAATSSTGKLYGSSAYTNNPTFSRSTQKQSALFYENNSYEQDPLVTNSATDDEDAKSSDYAVTLPTELEIESMMDDSTRTEPPRTSTPSSSKAMDFSDAPHLARNSPVGSHRTRIHIESPARAVHYGNNNNNHPTKHYSSSTTNDEDYPDFAAPMNLSQTTDDLANTSANLLNQSNTSGGELVGINDSSDQAIKFRELGSSSSGSPPDQPEKLPYTVQVFNDTIMSSGVPQSASRYPRDRASAHTQQQQQQQHSLCQDKIRELEKVTSSLTSTLESLSSQFVAITDKLKKLDAKVESQNETLIRLQKAKEDATFKQQTHTHPKTQPALKFSYSTSTINKLPLRNDHKANLMSTYTKHQGSPSSQHAANSSSSNISPPNRDATMSKSTSFYSNNSNNNLPVKHLSRSNIHASTSSIYADSFRSGSSISPTFNANHPHGSTSPNPTPLAYKRDQPSHTSMLSLNSNNYNGTLKPTVAGSVSNLSQIGGQLSECPSYSDYISGCHRAKEVAYSAEERLIRLILYKRMVTLPLPSWVDSSYNIDKVVEAPSVRLKLDWVHGYRGKDCRANIFFLPTGECVYFVSSIIVLYNHVDKTQRHYLGHTDTVKCLAVHPNKLIIASGQSAVRNKLDRRPIVRVWNTVSLATLRIIGFNEDFDRSICCIAFSKHDQGATMAVVDESNEHTITLIDWQREKNWRLAEANSGHEPVLGIDFHPIDKLSLVTIGKSHVNFWDVRGMTMTKKAGLFDKFDKPKYVLSMTFDDYGDTLTGDSNGNVIIWPRGGNRPKKVVHSAHQGGIFSILAMKDGSYLTGGRDRKIIEWDADFNRTGRESELPEHTGGVRYITYARGNQVLIGTLKNCIFIGSIDTNFKLIMQGHAEATSSLAVHPTSNRYLTGGFDEQIHLFDTTTHEAIWSKCIMMPATAASFSPEGKLLVVGSTLGKWLVIDSISREILFTKCDGSGSFSCIKFSPDGQYFAMASSDAQIYVYQTTSTGNKFCRIGTCVGHSAPVKELDWNDDNRFIQSQSMNFELLFWRSSNCRPVDDMNVIGDLKWSTHNCTVGFNVFGLWSDSIDSALINHCDKSNSDDLMVSVTDTGNINVFGWPLCYNQCLSQKYYGNVDRFDFIKFLHDDTKLVAIDSKGCATTEWTVSKSKP